MAANPNPPIASVLPLESSITYRERRFQARNLDLLMQEIQSRKLNGTLTLSFYQGRVQGVMTLKENVTA